MKTRKKILIVLKTIFQTGEVIMLLKYITVRQPKNWKLIMLSKAREWWWLTTGIKLTKHKKLPYAQAATSGKLFEANEGVVMGQAYVNIQVNIKPVCINTKPISKTSYVVAWNKDFHFWKDGVSGKNI